MDEDSHLLPGHSAKTPKNWLHHSVCIFTFWPWEIVKRIELLTELKGDERRGGNPPANDSGDDASGQTKEDNTAGQQTTGDDTAGQQTTGDDTAGQQTTGDDTAGQQTTGDDTNGQQTTGDDTNGQQTTGDNTDDEKTTRDNTNDQKTTWKCCPKLFKQAWPTIKKYCSKSLKTFTPLLLIIIGVLCQSATCFSRQNPYAHWVEDDDFLQTIDDNLTVQYCKLKCDIDKNYITGLLFPDFIILLLSLWIHLIWQIIYSNYEYRICNSNLKWLNSFCKLLKDYLNLTSLDTLVEDSGLTKQTIKIFTLFSIFYIGASFCISIFYLLAFGFLRKDVVIQSEISLISHTSAVVLSLLGFIAFDLLYIQVISRYAYRCKLLIEYLKSIKTREVQCQGTQQNQSTGVHVQKLDNVNQSQHRLQSAVSPTQMRNVSTETFTEHQRNIGKANSFLKELNKSTFTTEIVIVIAGFTAFSCFINLINTTHCPQFNQNWQVLAITLRLLLWLCIALFPFYMAAEVNEAACELIQKDYNFFISEARLIGIIIQPWIPKALLIIIIFAIIMLGSNTKYFHWL